MRARLLLAILALTGLLSPALAEEIAGREVVIDAGTTLYQVLRENYPDDQPRWNTISAALVAANPNAFDNGSPDQLIEGAVLRLVDPGPIMPSSRAVEQAAEPAAPIAVVETVNEETPADLPATERLESTAPAALPGPGAGSVFVVRDIRIDGLRRIDEGTVYNYLPVNIGDRIDARRIAESIRSIYATKFFSNVSVGREGDALVIEVIERPSIASFEIEGNEDIPTEDLIEAMRGVGLARGRVFERSTLDEVERFLTDQYFSQGKYGVRVETEVNDLEENRVGVAIKVVEGKRAQIRQINIVGNESFSESELLDELELKTPNFLSFIRQDDRYAREKLAGDIEKLRSYYMDRGYADFKLDSTQVSISPNKRDVYITLNVLEGDQYVIGDVDLAGDMVVDRQYLEPLVLANEGDSFSLKDLTRTSEIISQRLELEGYARAQVAPVPLIHRETKTVDVTFQIDPGQRIYVRRINFFGSENVNDEVFRREMRQFEGTFLSSLAVERSEQRIRRLPFVQEVSIETSDVPGQPDLVDLDVTIEEGLPGNFNAGFGYSASQGVILNGGFTHTNFLGQGERVSLNVAGSDITKLFSFSHTEPYVTPNEISRSVSFYYQDTTSFTVDTSDFSTETILGAVEYGFPISEYGRLSFGVSVQDADFLTSIFSAQQQIDFVQKNGNPFSVGEGEFETFGTEFFSYELTASWTRDSRNRFLFADRGSRHRFILNYALPGSEVEYYTARYNFTKYWPIAGRWALRLNSNVAIGEGLGDTTELPPFKNFFAGGPESVRGFSENRLGPVDSRGNPYGGNLLVANQLELLLPTPERFSGQARFALFLDAGNVFSVGAGDTRFFDPLTGQPLDFDFSTDELRLSTGLAAEWLAPIGVFRISYATPLNEKPGDDLEQLGFSVGSPF